MATARVSSRVGEQASVAVYIAALVVRGRKRPLCSRVTADGDVADSCLDHGTHFLFRERHAIMLVPLLDRFGHTVLVAIHLEVERR
jgi:hypothetical protein